MEPSHVTAAQAARILKVSKQTIYRKSLHGEPLESEKHYGTDMIPMERIKKYATNGSRRMSRM